MPEPPPTRSAYVGREGERIAALEKALRALVAVEPVSFEQGDSGGTCVYCEQYRERLGEPFPHTGGCPWVRARALLSDGSGHAPTDQGTAPPSGGG